MRKGLLKFKIKLQMY